MVLCEFQTTMTSRWYYCMERLDVRLTNISYFHGCSRLFRTAGACNGWHWRHRQGDMSRVGGNGMLLGHSLQCCSGYGCGVGARIVCRGCQGTGFPSRLERLRRSEFFLGPLIVHSLMTLRNVTPNAAPPSQSMLKLRNLKTRRLHREVTASMGDPSILFNNAGVTIKHGVRDVGEVSIEDFERTWRSNCGSAFLLSQLCIPAMEGKAWGRIVFCSSVAGFTGGVVGPHYA